MAFSDTIRPSRLSMLSRYSFPPLLLLLIQLRPLEAHDWLNPLLAYGAYSLLGLQLGWSERFFTLVTYAYALALYITGLATLEESLRLSLLLVAPVTLVTIEVERAFTEYRVSEVGVEVRGVRPDSLLPRLDTRRVLAHTVTSVKTHYPLLSRILGRRYVDLIVGTQHGKVVLKGIPSASDFPARAVKALDEQPPTVASSSLSITSVGEGFEVKSTFNPSLAGSALADFYRFIKFFSWEHRASLRLEHSATGQPAGIEGSEAKPKEEEASRGRRRNRIERLL
ncbi:hypothetical protein [Infirmifilum sp. SLHALR2]|nr:MAG: hypothetical protein B7L53_01520 [Thermofilum sp. NZ13]